MFRAPWKKLDEVSESNYFFKLTKYREQLTELISSDKLLIVPESRKNEVLSFLNQPLHDLSISRSNDRAKNWGVPVPDDDTQRIYVWFDALNIYQSGLDLDGMKNYTESGGRQMLMLLAKELHVFTRSTGPHSYFQLALSYQRNFLCMDM